MAKDTEALFPACPVHGYALRHAVEADVDFIFELDRSHMKTEVDRLYPGTWNDEHARSIIVENLPRARIVEWEGSRTGAYYWRAEEPSTAVLHSLQIAPAHRRKGLGRWLMGFFEAEAKAQGLTRAGLAVFDTNPALEFYRRLGYSACGRDGPSALAMEKAL
jgi:GNAT superfamily N-acetyltransferase